MSRSRGASSPLRWRSVTYLPPLQAILGAKPVSLADGILIVAIGVAFLALIEIEKHIRLGLRR